MFAIRYEIKKREVGESIPESRIWIDGDETEELLPGTSCLIPVQDKYTGHQYAAYAPNKYLVEGNWEADGFDDGEIILSDCKIVADLSVEDIEDYI
jgi:hypothetical protein